MKVKTARRFINRNRWKIARSRVDTGKIEPKSLRKRVHQAIKVIEEDLKKKD